MNCQIACLIEEGYLEKVCYGHYWMMQCGYKKPKDYKCIEVCLGSPRAVIAMKSACVQGCKNILLKNELFLLLDCICIGKGAQMLIDQYIQQYGKRLYGLCRFLCANPQDADDLYQDTWLKVIENISKYDSSRDFEPWLTKLCVNTYRNVLRRLRGSPFSDAFADNEQKDRVFEGTAAPEKPDYQALHEAVRRLPEKYRITVILFYFQDMDLEHTANVLGIPVGTVKSRLNKARRLLKEALKDETDLRF